MKRLLHFRLVLKLILCISGVCSLAAASSADTEKKLEPGFYSVFKNEIKSDEAVFELARKGDRVLWFSPDIDNISFGQETFTRAEMKRALSRDSKKNLLVAWFQKSIMWGGESEIEKTVEQLMPFFEDLGYRRLLILGCHSSGVFVVRDEILNAKPTSPDRTGAPNPPMAELVQQKRDLADRLAGNGPLVFTRIKIPKGNRLKANSIESRNVQFTEISIWRRQDHKALTNCGDAIGKKARTDLFKGQCLSAQDLCD